MVQALTLGEIDSPAEIRRIIRNSINISYYHHYDPADRNEVYLNFLRLT